MFPFCDLVLQSSLSPLQQPKTSKPQFIQSSILLLLWWGSGIMVSVNRGMSLPSLGVAEVVKCSVSVWVMSQPLQCGKYAIGSTDSQLALQVEGVTYTEWGRGEIQIGIKIIFYRIPVHTQLLKVRDGFTKWTGIYKNGM